MLFDSFQPLATIFSHNAMFTHVYMVDATTVDGYLNLAKLWVVFIKCMLNMLYFEARLNFAIYKVHRLFISDRDGMLFRYSSKKCDVICTSAALYMNICLH